MGRRRLQHVLHSCIGQVLGEYPGICERIGNERIHTEREPHLDEDAMALAVPCEQCVYLLAVEKHAVESAQIPTVALLEVAPRTPDYTLAVTEQFSTQAAEARGCHDPPVALEWLESCPVRAGASHLLHSSTLRRKRQPLPNQARKYTCWTSTQLKRSMQ